MNQMEKIANALVEAEHISKEEREALGEFGFFESLDKVAEEVEKISAILPGKLLGNVTQGIKALAIPAAAALTGAAVFKESIVDPIMQARKIKNSYKAMQDKVPTLAEKDQNQMRDYFNIVKTYSPKSASNPLVAGALVNKMMEFGGVDHKLVQDISAIEQGLQRPRVSQTVMEGAAKAVAGASV